jgi:hypothetical protein
MNAKKLAAFTDEQIKKVRELTAAKAKIEAELNALLGVKPRKKEEVKK